MPNLLAEKPAPRITRTQSAKLPPKKKRPMPPGQRLLLVAGMSTLLATPFFCINWHGPVTGAATTTKIAAAPVKVAPPSISLAYSLDGLKEKIAAVADLKDLRAGVFAYDPVSGKYVDFNGREQFSAASMIKVPIYVAMLQALDKKQVDLSQKLEITQADVTGGSGWLQWRPLGTKISLLDASDLMITNSDNTATNMIINLLGGKEVLNKSFDDWGLTGTKVNNLLIDLEGTNKTSPYDMVYLLARIDRGELLSIDSRRLMYKTMERTRIRTLLNYGLAPAAKIAHKTGDIGMMVGDGGIVTTPEGKKFFVSVQVERPHNDRRANLLIRALSKMIYKCFSSDSTDCADVPEEKLETPAAPVAHKHHSGHHHRHKTH